MPDALAFGKPNRPSTPINGVISNYYGESAQVEIEERYAISHELVSNSYPIHSMSIEEARKGDAKAKGDKSTREGSGVYKVEADYLERGQASVQAETLLEHRR